jgi:hypothetical protein
MAELTHEALTVLRVLASRSRRSFAGFEILERIFASTAERPMDPPQICDAVRLLEGRGLVVARRDGAVDPDYDFASVQVSQAGLDMWHG